MAEIKQGMKKVKDVLTGFEGSVTGYCTYLTGCDQALVQPPVDSDGKHVDGRWYDVKRLQVIDSGIITLPADDDGPCGVAPVK